MAEDGGTKLASVTVSKTAEAATSVPHALRSREEAEESEEDRVCLGRVLYVACCMWHVARGMLHVACCTWHVVCGMLYVACCMWHVVRGMLYVACRMWIVVCGMLYVACCMWHGDVGGCALFGSTTSERFVSK